MRGRKVSLWLHDEQKDGGWIEGHKLYEHLKSNNMLESCLGLRDLEEIQRRGIEFFRQHFKGKAVFGWKSAVRDSDGNLNAPCLYEGVGRVVLDWVWLSNGWSDCSPALRLKSRTLALVTVSFWSLTLDLRQNIAKTYTKTVNLKPRAFA